MKTIATIIILSLSLTLMAAATGTYSASSSLKVTIRLPNNTESFPDSATYDDEIIEEPDKMAITAFDQFRILDCCMKDNYMNIRVINADTVTHSFDFSFSVFSRETGTLLKSGFKEMTDIEGGGTVCFRYSIGDSLTDAYIVSQISSNGIHKRAGYSI